MKWHLTEVGIIYTIIYTESRSQDPKGNCILYLINKHFLTNEIKCNITTAQSQTPIKKIIFMLWKSFTKNKYCERNNAISQNLTKIESGNN